MIVSVIERAEIFRNAQRIGPPFDREPEFRRQSPGRILGEVGIGALVVEIDDQAVDQAL